MLPRVGASTCALGNQKWIKTIGSLTKKGRRKKREKREKMLFKYLYTQVVPVFRNRYNNKDKKGKENKIVYIRR